MSGGVRLRHFPRAGVDDGEVQSISDGDRTKTDRPFAAVAMSVLNRVRDGFPHGDQYVDTLLRIDSITLDRNEFVVHYQPLVNLRTGRITGSEALVRWQHPKQGLMGPTQFIPLTETSGLIRPLGLWVLRQACAQTFAWQRSSPDLRNLKISVNVSARQISDPDLFEQVSEILDETGLAPTCLTLEMTESILLENSEDVRTVLQRFRAHGIRLAIDDFGTGYSSLSYLHRFPIDVLKIDRSFIERLSAEGDGALVSTIVRLGQTMNLETVAEGVEQAEEMLMLIQQGCTTGQGFHFSPAIPADDLMTLLHDQSQPFEAQEVTLSV